MASGAADDRVLDLIFNPDQPVFGLEPDEGEDRVECESVPVEDSEEIKHAKLLEVQAVKVAEGGNLTDALELLTKTISEVPNYASCYNNRAQVYRLLSQVDLALTDLDTAIRLTNGQGKVAEQAYTQRGLIRRLRGDDDGAKEDFEAAATLGSRYARKQAVKLNPYAARCHEVMVQAFDKLRKGEET